MTFQSVKEMSDALRPAATMLSDRVSVTNAGAVTPDLVDRLVTRVTLDQNSMPYATNTYIYNSRGLTNMLDALNHLIVLQQVASAG